MNIKQFLAITFTAFVIPLNFDVSPVHAANIQCDGYGRCFALQVVCDNYGRCFRQWQQVSAPQRRNYPQQQQQRQRQRGYCDQYQPGSTWAYVCRR
jgi:hypothetical protein